MVERDFAEDNNLLIQSFKSLFKKIGLENLVELSLFCGMGAFFIYGLSEIIPRLPINLLTWPVLIGALAGGLTASTKLSGRQSFGVIVLSSFLFGLAAQGGLFWPLSQLTHKLSIQAMSIQAGLVLEPAENLQETARILLDIWARLGVLWERSLAWVESFSQAGFAEDNLILSVVWGLMLFWIGAWAGWVERRRGQTLAAALPAGILLAGGFAFSGAPISSLISFLGMVLLLLSWKNFHVKQHSWIKRQIDYAEDLRLDVSVSALVVTVMLLLVAGTATLFSIEKIEDFLDRFRSVGLDAASSEAGIGETFGLERRPAVEVEKERQARTSPGMTGLPRSHLLGSGPELSQEMVMRVSTGDLPRLPSEIQNSLTIPRYYWKAINYDVYTGSGWRTSQTESVSYPSGQAILPGFILFPTEGRSIYLNPTYRQPEIELIRQEIAEEVNMNGLAYSAGEFLGMDQNYRVEWRSTPDVTFQTGVEAFGDIFAVKRKQKERTYQAWSARSRPGEMELRGSNPQSADSEYPGWLRERYLSLPETVPPRVLSLAKDLTQDQPTTYDKALAIEGYLRKFPYSLDLPQPPTDQDIVDYFLFDLQTGYCDYYATAMVVLARAAGLPARLAVGYASGNYSPPEAVYLVTEKDGHSWPEVYFPGLGWVEFEPTAAFPVIDRPASDQGLEERVSQPEDFPPFLDPNINFDWKSGLILGVFLFAFLLSIIYLVDKIRFGRLKPAQMIQLTYQRIYRKAADLGASARPGDTPTEFSTRFSRWMTAARISTNQKVNRRWQEFISPNAEEVIQVSDLYNRLTYSQHPPVKKDGTKAWQSWLKLRWPLRLLRLRRKRQVEP